MTVRWAARAHVIDAFNEAPRPHDSTDWPVSVLLLYMTEHGMAMVNLPVEAVYKPRTMPVTGVYYGEKPDLGLVHVRMRVLPSVRTDPKPVLQEGRSSQRLAFRWEPNP